MQDNNGQNTVNNQPSIPQVNDMPPFPATPVTPLPPSVSASIPDEPANAFAPPTAIIPPIPQMSMEVPQKKSPITMIALVLFIIALLAGGTYFVGKVFMGKTASDTTKTESLVPADGAMYQDGSLNTAPPQDPELGLDDVNLQTDEETTNQGATPDGVPVDNGPLPE